MKRRLSLMRKGESSVLATIIADFDESVGNLNDDKRLYFVEEDLAPADVVEVRAYWKERVDQVAGQARKRFISDAPGQQMTYLRIDTEVAAYLDDVSPNRTAENYPWIFGIVDALAGTGGAKTADEMAAYIAGSASAWTGVGIQIEGLRRKGHALIDDATNEAEVQQAADTVISQLDLIGA